MARARDRWQGWGSGCASPSPATDTEPKPCKPMLHPTPPYSTLSNQRTAGCSQRMPDSQTPALSTWWVVSGKL